MAVPFLSDGSTPRRTDPRWSILQKILGTGSTGGGGGGSGTPGGANTQVQYNSAGSFAGSANLVWDNANKELILTNGAQTITIAGGSITFNDSATTIGSPGRPVGALFVHEVNMMPADAIYWNKVAGVADQAVFDQAGTGSPEGVIPASVGAVWRRFDGGVGTTLYIKQSGVGTTGWVPVATVSGSVSNSTSWYTIVGGEATAADNGTALVAAYAAAILKTPGGVALSASNRHTIFLLPGVYSVTGGALVMNTQFVDIVGLSTNTGAGFYVSPLIDHGDTIITSTGHTLEQSANDVTIANVCLRTSSATQFAWNLTTAVTTASKMLNVLITNTNAVATPSMPAALTLAGYYEDVRAWNQSSFGNSNTAVCSGTFIRCKAGAYSFATALSSGSIASGTFTDCEADGASFGTNGTASGIFDRCKYVAVDTTSSPMFGGSGVASGRFTNCVANGITGSFGATASGSFRICFASSLGTGSAFGGGGGTASGNFFQCVGGAGSYGGNNGGAGGTFSGGAVSCSGQGNCFGGGSTTAGVMSGLLLSCKMASRLNAVVSGRIEETDILASGTNEDAVLVTTNARIARCTLVGTGTGFSVNATAPVSAAIYHCAMNLGFGPNVTNLITTPYNVNDADII